VLVVEDNGDNALSMKMLLEIAGCEVAVAGDGLVGLELARRWHPDLVLLDIGLPRMNGFEVAKVLRAEADTADLRIVAISAFEPEAFDEAERDARFSGRLVKPVLPEALLELLKAVG
jgi:CheY-like chemotaxis protein